ncbi:MAG: 16S rRNA (guanine(527)-N(7))-methyltransferase RsmG [Fimbriimonadaceae bacterium]
MNLRLLEPAHAYLSLRGLALNEDRRARLEAFFLDLYAENEEYNLTRVAPEDFALRHFVDSLRITEAVEPVGYWLDLGCGPGFPSWPLALVYPDLRVTAMDGSAKPLGFLRRHLLPNLDVVQGRAEDLGAPRYDVVTGRALAPCAVQAEVSLPWVAVGGCFVPFRTPTELEAIRAFPAASVGAELEAVYEVGEPARLFPVFRKTSATPPGSRRSWATIKSRPLS